MSEVLVPLDAEPVSVHAPFISYPTGHYRHEPAWERHAALLAALDGVELGAYDDRVLRWLAGWNVPVVAGMVSLFWRVRHVEGAQQAHQGGGEPR
jgi:hypothetical protein